MKHPRTAITLAVLSIVTLTGVSALGPSSTRDTAAAQPLLMIGRAHPVNSFPATDGRRPMFFLVLGSDSRSKKWSAIQHSRSDLIQLVGVNPASGCSTILGFPRDSWVSLPGHGMNKINDAMYFGGPRGAIAQIESLTGTRIDYWALTSFWNFRTMVHSLGGVDVDVPYPMNDQASKAHFRAGRQHLSGKGALAFARDRHDPPNGDFGRSFNQGTLLISFLRDFQQAFRQNPASMLDWLGAGIRNVKANIPFSEMLQLGFLASQIRMRRVNNFVVPGSTGMVGTQSVVHISPSARSMYANLRADGCIANR